MGGGEDTEGSPKKENKKEGEEIVTTGKDEMDNTDTQKSKESQKKEQQIIFIFSQQVISDQSWSVTNDKIFKI